MMTRYLERRRFIRVPVSGPARYRCGRRSGECQLTDISPAGLGLRFSARSAPRLGDTLEVMVDVSPGVAWELTSGGTVVRRQPGDDGWCSIGLEFTADDEATADAGA